MATLQLNLPNEFAQRAQSFGLLSDVSMRKLLEDAIQREVGRCLLIITQKLHAVNIPPLSDEEIVAEFKERRGSEG